MSIVEKRSERLYAPSESRKVSKPSVDFHRRKLSPAQGGASNRQGARIKQRHPRGQALRRSPSCSRSEKSPSSEPSACAARIFLRIPSGIFTCGGGRVQSTGWCEGAVGRGACKPWGEGHLPLRALLDVLLAQPASERALLLRRHPVKADDEVVKLNVLISKLGLQQLDEDLAPTRVSEDVCERAICSEDLDAELCAHWYVLIEKRREALATQ
eukprot:2102386-Prymnesium_polylepis.1